MKTTLDTNSIPNSIEHSNVILAQVLSKKYISIAAVDLHTGIAAVLKSQGDEELEQQELPWSTLLERYAKRRVYPDDRDLILSLTSNYLETILESGKDEFSLEVRCVSEMDSYIWVEIGIVVLSVPEKKLLITTRNISKDRILQRIVDMYVFQDMDYFILLDAKHNSYTMFSGNNKLVPLPPKNRKNYTEEMINYNKQYLLPEDQEQVIANMQISHIISMLAGKDRYSFYCDAIGMEGDYRRTRVQYQYYDRSMELILLTRTDVTQVFLEEQAKHNRLANALRDAQYDSLTNLYNQKATANLIADTLKSKDWNQAAFLFIDIDNFKMVNDTLGHQAGDTLLKFAASSIQHLAGCDGIAGRVGGDEFLLFLPADYTTEVLDQLSQKICGIFDSLPESMDKTLPISCSVGISVYPKDGADYETLVRKADQALYNSKRYGKNRFYYYSQDEPAI